MSKYKNIILALSGETEEKYNIRNKDEGIRICTHNYDGQDDLKQQYCRYCGCLNYNIYVNERYNIYYDDYN